jgi:hypothetical protein
LWLTSVGCVEATMNVTASTGEATVDLAVTSTEWLLGGALLRMLMDTVWGFFMVIVIAIVTRHPAWVPMSTVAIVADHVVTGSPL